MVASPICHANTSSRRDLRHARRASTEGGATRAVASIYNRVRAKGVYIWPSRFPYDRWSISIAIIRIKQAIPASFRKSCGLL